MAILLAILGLFVVLPVAAVLKVALTDADGSLTLAHVFRFFENPLYIESLINSLTAGFWAVVLGTVLALPLAFIVARYEFPGRTLVLTLSTLPLVIPPFVGAIALMQVFGRAGVVTLLLQDFFGIRNPLMEGLRGIESPRIREVRGLGLMVGLELKENAGPAIRSLQDRRVLALGAGPTVVRYLPPLVITSAQIEAVIAATASALSSRGGSTPLPTPLR